MGSVTTQTQNLVNYMVLLLSFLLMIVIFMDYKSGMFSNTEGVVVFISPLLMVEIWSKLYS